MNRFRLVSVGLLAVILIIAQAPPAAQASAPRVAAAYVPVGGEWTGTTDRGYPVSFTVNAVGTLWSDLSIRTYIARAGVCRLSISANLSGPGPVSSNTFGATDGSLVLTGTFTSQTVASGTYAWTNARGITGCNQKGTWTAKAPFSKLNPPNESTDQAVSPTLTWNASSGATRYEYCLDTASHPDGDSTCPSGWQNNGTVRNVAISSPLNEVTPYYWQVRAVYVTNSVANYVYANTGAWWSFTTGTLPGTFGKAGPTDLSTGQALDSSLSWGTSTGATSYQYCFDTVDNDACDATWTSVDGSTTTVNPAGVFLPGTTYYWQVRAMNSTGPIGADSGDWWSFTTIPPLEFDVPSNGGQDGFVLESYETSNIGGKANSLGATFTLGDDRRNRQYRGILSFSTNTIPANAVITGVTLKVLKAPAASSVSPFSVLGNIVVDVRKGAFGKAALQITDFQASANKMRVATMTNTPDVNGWYSVSLPSTSFGFINRGGLTQFRLRFAKDDNNNRAANYMTFYSGNDLTPANWPQLVILYYTSP